MLRYIVFSLVLGLGACQMYSKPKFNMQQRRAMQVRSFDTSYKNVFNAFKSVLQDEGYIIKNLDFEGGMVLAEKENAGGTSAFAASLMGRDNYVTGKGFSVSVSFDEITENNIETRMTLQSMTRMSRGGMSGTEVVEPTIYKTIYDRVRVEIQRRTAQGKS